MWDGGNVIAKGGFLGLVDKDAEESCGFVARVRLELRLGIDGEWGGENGQRDSPQPSQHNHTQASCETHEDQSVVK